MNPVWVKVVENTALWRLASSVIGIREAWIWLKQTKDRSKRDFWNWSDKPRWYQLINESKVSGIGRRHSPLCVCLRGCVVASVAFVWLFSTMCNFKWKKVRSVSVRRDWSRREGWLVGQLHGGTESNGRLLFTVKARPALTGALINETPTGADPHPCSTSTLATQNSCFTIIKKYRLQDLKNTLVTCQEARVSNIGTQSSDGDNDGDLLSGNDEGGIDIGIETSQWCIINSTNWG